MHTQRQHASRAQAAVSAGYHLHELGEAAGRMRHGLPRGIRQAVEETVASLEALREAAISGFRHLTEAAEAIESGKDEREIDPEGRLVAAMERDEKTVVELIQAFDRRIEAAFRDPRLYGEDERRVIDAYVLTTDALRRLHDASVRLRWAIMEHDADLSPVGPAFDNAEDLIAYLKR